MSDLLKAREEYKEGVEKERKQAHWSSVWLLSVYRVLRAVTLVASAATPVLVLLNAEKVWTALVAASAAIALGLIQLTSLDELSLLDRARANRLRRVLRCFDTKTGSYAEASDTDQYRILSQEVETIRSDWEGDREALVRRSFLQRLDKTPGRAQRM